MIRGIAVIVGVVVLVPAAAVGGIVLNVGVLAGDQNSLARDINDAGVVVGSSYGTVPTDPIPTNYFHAFSFTAAGGLTRLGTLTSYPNPVNNAYGVNQSGVIVGTQQSNAFTYSGAGPMQTVAALAGGADINDSGAIAGQLSNSHAGLYLGSGSPTDLGTLPGSSQGSAANAINNALTVVGYAQTNNFVKHAFRYTAATGLVSLDSLSSTDGSEAKDINNFGVIVGATGGTSGTAFRYSGNGPMELLPKGTYGLSFANGINDDGFIVGGVRVNNIPSAPDIRAALWKPDKTMIELDPWLDSVSPQEGAFWTLRHAYAINATGQIVGDGDYNDGAGGLPDGTFGFVLDASALVPEPSAALLVPLCGTILLRRSSNKPAAVR